MPRGKPCGKGRGNAPVVGQRLLVLIVDVDRVILGHEVDMALLAIICHLWCHGRIKDGTPSVGPLRALTAQSSARRLTRECWVMTGTMRVRKKSAVSDRAISWRMHTCFCVSPRALWKIPMDTGDAFPKGAEALGAAARRVNDISTRGCCAAFLIATESAAVWPQR